MRSEGADGDLLAGLTVSHDVNEARASAAAAATSASSLLSKRRSKRLACSLSRFCKPFLARAVSALHDAVSKTASVNGFRLCKPSLGCIAAVDKETTGDVACVQERLERAHDIRVRYRLR